MNNEEKIVLVFSILILALMSVNLFMQGTNFTMLTQQQSTMKQMMLVGNYASNAGTQNNQTTQTNGSTLSFEEFLPKGVPAIYGAELGVSFDDPVASLDVMSALDGDLYQDGKIKFADLTEDQQKSYIQIGYSISCEFCCEAEYIVAPNGQPACGCAHSAAMRGLAKYLLINHGSEMTNEQILNELVQWKTMFFPKQMYERALTLSGSAPSVIDSVPDMVGGC